MGDNALRIENPARAKATGARSCVLFNKQTKIRLLTGLSHETQPGTQDSVETIIGSSWEIAGGTPALGMMQIVDSLPNGGAAAPCNPGAAYTPTANLNGWVTHAQDISRRHGIPRQSRLQRATAPRLRPKRRF